MRGAALSALWALATAAALLWPGRLIGPLDGAPLDGRLEAIVIGLVLPSLWWLDRQAWRARWFRVLVLTLLLWKALAGTVVTQQGLCAVTLAQAPIDGLNQGIPIQEPSGVLRSWDLRADWRHPAPTCTAILARPLPTQEAFPAWFLNVTDQMLGARDFTMHVRGFVYTSESRTLTIDVGRDVRLGGRVNEQPIDEAPMLLAAGVHSLDLALGLTGNNWRFEPKLDGRPLWAAALVTTAPAGLVDRLLASWGWVVSPVLVLALVMGLVARVFRRLRPGTVPTAWIVLSMLAAIVLAVQPISELHRAAGLLGLAAMAVPVGARLRNLKGAFLMVGVPWLAFFAAWSIAQVGHFSVYSYDDWLTYQVAGYRIFMHGYWLEGGNVVFDFQPLYRWMTGGLHLIFGDSSVGEVYWDATCLLIGALLAFHCVKTVAGYRWALLAASATLATFTLGTPWYFLGRGLSEIAAAGWAFLALFFLLRARRGSPGWAASATVMAVLMFYTRLNHLLFAAFLPGMLLSLRVPATFGAFRRAVSRMPRIPVAVLAGGFVAGVLAFMARTWYYTGAFSLFYGTSLRHNDTGLRPWTLLDGEVWMRVSHSLATLVFMNEPPRPDPRAAIMIAGALITVAALIQTPIARRLPAAVVWVAAGASVGAFLAHAHGYPGRFSIHLVPFASALTMVIAAAATRACAARWQAR
jgi:hypothetical protein